MSTTVQKYIFTDSFKTTLLTCVETWTFLLRSWVRVDWSSCYCSMTAGFAANFDTTWQFWTSLISVAQLQCNRHRNIDTVHHCCHFIYESDNRSSCMTVSYRCMSLSNSRTVSDFRCRWSCHRTETDADGLENNFKTTPYFASPSRQIRYYLRARCSNIPQRLVIRQHHISCRIVMLRRRKLTIYARFLPRSETCCWTHFGPDPPRDTIRTNHRPDHTNVGIYFSLGAFLTNSLIGWIWCHWKYCFSSVKEGIPFFMTIPGSWGCRSGEAKTAWLD